MTSVVYWGGPPRLLNGLIDHGGGARVRAPSQLDVKPVRDLVDGVEDRNPTSAREQQAHGGLFRRRGGHLATLRVVDDVRRVVHVRDRAVHDVLANRVEVHPSRQPADHVVGLSAVVGGARLQDRVTDVGLVGVGEHVVVAEDREPSEAGVIGDQASERPSGDVAMADADPGRRGALTDPCTPERR